MKFVAIILVSLLGSGNGIPEKTTALIDRLLSTVDSSEYFLSARQHGLDSMKSAASNAVPLSEEDYWNCYNIGRSYFKFSSDSSVHYLQKAEKVARSLGNDEMMARARLKKVQVLTSIGFFKEASDILDSVEVQPLPRELKSLYYSTNSLLYHGLYVFDTSFPEMHNRYVEMYNRSQDSLSIYLENNSEEYLRILEKRYAKRHEIAEAMEINDRRFALSQEPSLRTALLYFDRFAIVCVYDKKPIEQGIDYLLQSATYDVIFANQETGSLKYIINYLWSHNCILEAKRLSEYYYQTMVRNGNRIQRANAFDSGVEINDAYVDLIFRQTRRITTGLVFIALLAAVLLVLSVLMFRSRRKIMRLNTELERSNRVSRSYVVEFFRLYSTYIDRNLKFRAKINTGLRRGKTAELIELTNPDKDVFDEELKIMYRHFDSSFLEIFPDYVENFNLMMKPEFRVTLKPEELNTEMRVFALVKMGVTDSGQISELLHYTVKTVYNKRSAIKTRIQVPLDEFYAKL